MENFITKSRKAINFDLDTSLMRSKGVYPNGYKQLGNSLNKQGFEHRQGSGYISQKELQEKDIHRILRKATKENPWLKDCVNKIDVTDIGRQFDMTNVVRKTKVQQNNASNTKQLSPQLQQMQAQAKKQRMQQQGKATQKAAVKQNNGNFMG